MEVLKSLSMWPTTTCNEEQYEMPETWTSAHDAHGEGETLKRQNAHRRKFQKPINHLNVAINALTKLNVRVIVGSPLGHPTTIQNEGMSYQRLASVRHWDAGYFRLCTPYWRKKVYSFTNRVFRCFSAFWFPWSRTMKLLFDVLIHVFLCTSCFGMTYIADWMFLC